jgi:formiminotetrahydrofolate cyclodeaminase
MHSGVNEMPIPAYVPKKKHEEYRIRHREIALAVTGKVKSPYAVATQALAGEYRPKKKARKKR